MPATKIVERFGERLQRAGMSSRARPMLSINRVAQSTATSIQARGVW